MNTPQQKKLGTLPIPKLLTKQSLPAIVGLIVMSLYNIVDTIFVGQSVGTLGIAALAIAFPIQMLIVALAQTFGIGASSMISRALGAKQKDKAETTLGTFFTLIILLGVTTTTLGLLFLEPLGILFGASSDILPPMKDYLSIVLWGSVFSCFTAAVSNIIRSEGNAKTAMMIMIISTIVNIVLDPILIFGFDLGIRGAALATVSAQIFATGMALHYFISKKNAVRLHLHNLKPSGKLSREMISVGASSLTRQSASSVVQAILNNTLGRYGGDLAIASFGIIMRIFMVTLMPMIGFSQGMQPVLGYNYGARKFARSKQAITVSMRNATIFSIGAFMILMVFTRPIVNAFSSDPELIKLTVHAGRIIFLGTGVIGFQIIASGMYQALGKARKAILLSLLRQVCILIPLLLILPRFFQIEGVFWSFPIADISACIIIWFMTQKELRKFDKKESEDL